MVLAATKNYGWIQFPNQVTMKMTTHTVNTKEAVTQIVLIKLKYMYILLFSFPGLCGLMASDSGAVIVCPSVCIVYWSRVRDMHSHIY